MIIKIIIVVVCLVLIAVFTYFDVKAEAEGDITNVAQ
jgi:hypothetical protein